MNFSSLNEILLCVRVLHDPNEVSDIVCCLLVCCPRGYNMNVLPSLIEFLIARVCACVRVLLDPTVTR